MKYVEFFGTRVELADSASAGCMVAAVLFVFLVGLAFAIGMPFAAIFALNTLFSLSLDYGLKEWFAAFIVLSIIRSATGGYNKS